MPSKEDLSEKLIKDCEGLLLIAKKDIFGKVNIGYGQKEIYPDGSKIYEGHICTEPQACIFLKIMLSRIYRTLDKLCRTKNVPDRVYAALASFCYNGGVGMMGPSILSAINKQDWIGLAEAFKLYNKVTVEGVKVYSKGLENRRQKEIDFMKG